MTANLFFFIHFRKSGEVIVDNVEGVVVEYSKEHVNLTNLFNGNQLLEKAGNAIINTSGKNLIRSTVDYLVKATAKAIEGVIITLFSNSTKAELELYFPESKIENEEAADGNDIRNGIDLSVSKNYKSPNTANVNLQNQIDYLKSYMNLITFILILFILILLAICLIFKIHFSKFKPNYKSNDEHVSKKLISKQEI